MFSLIYKNTLSYIFSWDRNNWIPSHPHVVNFFVNFSLSFLKAGRTRVRVATCTGGILSLTLKKECLDYAFTPTKYTIVLGQHNVQLLTRTRDCQLLYQSTVAIV